jgi:predicted O-methyltransferase YrrM
MVFIGASLVDSDAYYESSLTLLRPGGLVVMAGTSPGKHFADARGKSRTQAITALNVNVRHDPRVETMSIPIGGGMLVARKK